MNREGAPKRDYKISPNPELTTKRVDPREPRRMYYKDFDGSEKASGFYMCGECNRGPILYEAALTHCKIPGCVFCNRQLSLEEYREDHRLCPECRDKEQEKEEREKEDFWETCPEASRYRGEPVYDFKFDNYYDSMKEMEAFYEEGAVALPEFVLVAKKVSIVRDCSAEDLLEAVAEMIAARMPDRFSWQVDPEHLTEHLEGTEELKEHLEEFRKKQTFSIKVRGKRKIPVSKWQIFGGPLR